ncbi:hypothetical protein [Micromonospora chalcea]|uniref:hypothetical protein n=1 Tax=Micromonospora chalcea TaxID=1874 RepID=UPI00157C7014|nr:hypothetical protein [Micromonospora chalcea]
MLVDSSVSVFALVLIPVLALVLMTVVPVPVPVPVLVSVAVSMAAGAVAVASSLVAASGGVVTPAAGGIEPVPDPAPATSEARIVAGSARPAGDLGTKWSPEGPKSSKISGGSGVWAGAVGWLGRNHASAPESLAGEGGVAVVPAWGCSARSDGSPVRLTAGPGSVRPVPAAGRALMSASGRSVSVADVDEASTSDSRRRPASASDGVASASGPASGSPTAPLSTAGRGAIGAGCSTESAGLTSARCSAGVGTGCLPTVCCAGKEPG